MNDIQSARKYRLYSFCGRYTNAFYSDTSVKALKQTYPNGYKRKKHFEYQENQVILFKDKNKKIKEPLKLKIDGEEIM